MKPTTSMDIELSNLSENGHYLSDSAESSQNQMNGVSPASFALNDSLLSEPTVRNSNMAHSVAIENSLESKRWYRSIVLVHSILTHTPQGRSREILSRLIQKHLQPDVRTNTDHDNRYLKEDDNRESGGRSNPMSSFQLHASPINDQNRRDKTIGGKCKSQKSGLSGKYRSLPNSRGVHNHDTFDDGIYITISLILACVAVFILPLYDGIFVYYARWFLIITSSYFGPLHTNGFYSILGVLILGMMINRPLTVCSVCLGAWSWVVLIGIVTDAMGIKYYN
ncbi:hypothetical protein NADFUDRAFT_52104 [Nadsonia fulvescens var. elongata DSM 6958]|uniref:Uncharacterized protein n=1 Tax=Nadsonia fulvescens var. elongata DSM 6958 TaxID=857566 RepID=A0A1E3PGD3_9ASCO|nr:hypothetical protein NADFUDRAFT_52104 [Nadsonia fulvescens var. elongata DSM 6958]